MRTFYQAFEKDNARTESMSSILETFVPTEDYWELFSRQNQIVLGCRGSGKTALMKMISFPYVVSSGLERAIQKIKSEKIIGIHVSTDIRFTGSLKNKIWQNEEQEERYFVWKLNINILKALLSSLPSILNTYMPKNFEARIVEADLCAEIHKYIFNSEMVTNFDELIDILDDYETRQQHRLISEFRDPSIEKVHIDIMSTDLMSPLNTVFRMLKRLDHSFDEVTWFICLDEAEYLTEVQMRTLNSYMRTFGGQIFFKIATMPFSHSTKDTNINVPVFADDDFKYIYLDNSPDRVLNEKGDWVHEFAQRIFDNRIRHHFGPDVKFSIEDVLGTSPSDGFPLTSKSLPDLMSKLEEHTDPRTIARAKKIVGKRSDLRDKRIRQKLSDQIWRKVSGLIHLREAQQEAKGNRQYAAYHGREIYVRCTDGVPRRMINLFYAVSKEAFQHQQRYKRRGTLAHSTALGKAMGGITLTKQSQSKLLRKYSDLRYQQIESVPKLGLELRRMIDELNEYFYHKLHGELISTDVVSMFKVTDETPDEVWKIVEAGVEYGYIFPNRSKDARIYRPVKKGSYRLAFALAPRASLMPRRGKAITIQTILRMRRRHSKGSTPSLTGQLNLQLGSNHED